MREELNEKDLIYLQIARMLEDDILREYPPPTSLPEGTASTRPQRPRG